MSINYHCIKDILSYVKHYLRINNQPCPAHIVLSPYSHKEISFHLSLLYHTNCIQCLVKNYNITHIKSITITGISLYDSL